MPGFLRQATASQARALGPFLDDTDFKTAETGLTIANTDIKLVVNGGASANKNSGGGTHRVNGEYGVTFDATDTATVGEMKVSVVVSGALNVFDKFIVLEEPVYDALFAASAPGYVVDQPVNVTKLLGTAVSTPATAGILDVNLKNIANATVSASTAQLGVNVVNNAGSAITSASGIQEVKVASIAANAITATAINADAITAAKIADGAIDAATFAAGAINAAAIAADAITDAKVASDVTIASVTGAVGSVAGNVAGNVSGTIGGLTVAAIKDFFDTDSGTTYGVAVAGSVVKEIADNAGGSALTVAGIADGVWDELLSGHAVSGSAGEALSAAGSAGDPWLTALPGAYGSGTAGKIIGDNINATVSSRASQTSLDTLDDLVDTEVAAIKTQTDKLTFTVANQIDANVLDWKSATAPAMTGDAFARLGAPAGASVSADVAAVKAQTAAIETDTAEIGAAGAGLTNIDLPNQTMNIAGNITGNLSGSVGSVTGNVGGNVVGSVASVTAGVSVGTAGIGAGSFAANAIDNAALATSAVTEIANAIAALACTEPTAVVAASPTLIAAVSWLVTLSRNLVTQTATTQTLKADDGSTTIATSTVSDDGTTFSRAEWT